MKLNKQFVGRTVKVDRRRRHFVMHTWRGLGPRNTEGRGFHGYLPQPLLCLLNWDAGEPEESEQVGACPYSPIK